MPIALCVFAKFRQVISYVNTSPSPLLPVSPPPPPLPSHQILYKLSTSISLNLLFDCRVERFAVLAQCGSSESSLRMRVAFHFSTL